MGRTTTKTSQESQKKHRRATTPEARENQIIAAAYDLAEQQILNGTASSQVISHFLKMGSPQGRLEKSMMEEQKKLLEAKTEALKSQKQIEEVYTKAIEAMRIYSGNGRRDENDEDDY